MASAHSSYLEGGDSSPRHLPPRRDDVEKQKPQHVSPERRSRFGFLDNLRVQQGEVYEIDAEKYPRWYQRLLDAGAEENGIRPVPLAQRTNRQYSNMFTMFFTGLLCLLP